MQELSSDIKSISEITQNRLFKVEKGTDNITNSRQLIIKDFTDRLNQERKGTKWGELKPRTVAIKLGHLDEFDLHFFYKKCCQAKTFTGCFWASLKAK